MKNNIVQKKIARGFLDKNKLFKRILIITILISNALIFILFLLNGARIETHKRSQYGKAQVKLIGISDEQFNELKKIKTFDWVGIENVLGVSKDDKYNKIIKYEDTNFIKKQARYNLQGNIPLELNQVVLSSNFIDKYEDKKTIGDNIELDLLGDGNIKDYEITGILSDEKKSKSFDFYISNKLWEKLSQDKLNTVYVRLNTEEIDSTKLIEYTEKSIENTSIKKGQIFLTEYFSVMNGLDRRDERADLLIFFIIIVTLTGLLIYSTFYNSMMEDIKYLGQLRSIGYDKKMVRYIVKKQARIVSLKGFILSLPIPILISYLIYPEGFLITNVIKSMGYTFLINYLTVFISIIPIINKINKISVIEGVNYSIYNNKKVKNTKKITFRYLVQTSLFRNKKKTILTLILMILSSSIVILTMVLDSSIDINKRARTLYFPDGQIQVSISNIPDTISSKENNDFYSIKIQRENNPLRDKQLLKEIKEIKGVNKINRHNSVNVGLTKQNKEGSLTTISDNFKVINEDEYNKLKPFLNTKLNYSDLVNKRWIISSDNLANVNDRFKMSYRSQDDKIKDTDVQILGVYQKTEVMKLLKFVPNNEIMIPIELVNREIGLYNPIGILSIDIDEEVDYNLVKDEIMDIINKHEHLDIWSMDEALVSIGYKFEQSLRLIKIISIILVIFSLIIITTSYFSSLYTRKAELELFRNLGFTLKEIVQLIVSEYRRIIFGSIIPAIIGSTIISYFLLDKLDYIYNIINFKFPLIWLGIYFASQILLLKIIELFTEKKLDRKV